MAPVEMVRAPLDDMNVARAVVGGVVDYSDATQTMDRLRKRRIDDSVADTILFLQHPEIVTMGPRARKEGAKADGYRTVDVDRGGGMTWHGPGQLVIYPIIKWLEDERGVPQIVSKMEHWVISALADCGVTGVRNDVMMGVWVDGYKICSVGLAFRNWVSKHGISINIETPGTRVEDLDCCGLSAGTTTSLHKLGHTHDLEGRFIDRDRIMEAMIQTSEEAISRVLSPPLSWRDVS
tara:strand:+ start:2404 stop:3111 length:708 start_codon:yes stop_codon:yes gene_type:complete